MYFLVPGKNGAKLQLADPTDDAKATTGADSDLVLTPMGQFVRDVDKAGPRLVSQGVKLTVRENAIEVVFSQVAKLAQFLSADSDRPVVDSTDIVPVQLEMERAFSQ